MNVRLLTVPLLLALVVGGVVTSCSDSGDTTEAGSGAAKHASTTLSDQTIPTLADIPGPAGACLSAAATFTELAQGVLQGPDGAKTSEKAAEDLKKQLPPELAADADTLAQVFKKVADAGSSATASLLDDPAYAKANSAIAAYFDQQCGGASSSTTTTTAG